MKKLLFVTLVLFISVSSKAEAQKSEILYDGSGLDYVYCNRDGNFDDLQYDTDSTFDGNDYVLIKRQSNAKGIKYEVYINNEFRATCDNISLNYD